MKTTVLITVILFGFTSAMASLKDTMDEASLAAKKHHERIEAVAMGEQK